jgi:hypothetical protein
MRRKGELSPAGIDRGWPHQVVLPARFSQRGSGYQEIHDFCRDLTLCNRGHAGSAAVAFPQRHEGRQREDVAFVVAEIYFVSCSEERLFFG